MTEQEQALLQNLRVAASNRQWNLCREYTKHLLPSLSQVDTVKILSDRIERFLSDFLSPHLQDIKTFDFITSTDNITSFEDLDPRVRSTIDYLKDRSDEPGINNFRNALKKLHNLRFPDHFTDTYFDSLIDILSGILMAILLYDWGNQHPDLWQRWFRQESQQDFLILAKYFWPNPRTIELNRVIWNETADKIEAAL